MDTTSRKMRPPSGRTLPYLFPVGYDVTAVEPAESRELTEVRRTEWVPRPGGLVVTMDAAPRSELAGSRQYEESVRDWLAQEEDAALAREAGCVWDEAATSAETVAA